MAKRDARPLLGYIIGWFVSSSASVLWPIWHPAVAGTTWTLEDLAGEIVACAGGALILGGLCGLAVLIAVGKAAATGRKFRRLSLVGLASLVVSAPILYIQLARHGFEPTDPLADVLTYFATALVSAVGMVIGINYSNKPSVRSLPQ